MWRNVKKYNMLTQTVVVLFHFSGFEPDTPRILAGPSLLRIFSLILKGILYLQDRNYLGSFQ